MYWGGKIFCREKLLWEKFCPKFRDSIFPAILRIAEFYQHKDSNYWQNTIKNFRRFAPIYIYIFHTQLDRTVIFSKQNKDWDKFLPAEFSQTEFFPDRVFPGQSFTLTGTATMVFRKFLLFGIGRAAAADTVASRAGGALAGGRYVAGGRPAL